MTDNTANDAQGATLAELGQFYRRHLLEDVIPFWEQRTKDEACGGYLTCFDRAGRVTDTDKYIRFQGRQLWMFSALCHRLEQRESWLDLAQHGRDFIVKHAYAGQGRWYYQLDRSGKPKKATISIFTDHFVLSGLCEYALAAETDEDLPLIHETYDAIEAADPQFKDIFHGTWSPLYKRHGIYMMSLHVAGLAERILGCQRTRPLIDYCLDQILHVFAKDDHQMLFESVSSDGDYVDDAEGRVFNPGHTLESMWSSMNCRYPGFSHNQWANNWSNARDHE